MRQFLNICEAYGDKRFWYNPETKQTIRADGLDTYHNHMVLKSPADFGIDPDHEAFRRYIGKPDEAERIKNFLANDYEIPTLAMQNGWVRVIYSPSRRGFDVEAHGDQLARTTLDHLAGLYDVTNAYVDVRGANPDSFHLEDEDALDDYITKGHKPRRPFFERYTNDNTYLLRYLSDAGFDPYPCWHLCCEWIENNDLLEYMADAIGEDLNSASDLEEYEPDVFYKLSERDQKACGEWVVEYLMANAPSEAPSTAHFDVRNKKLLDRETWLVHFSDRASTIASLGFTIGMDEMDKLGLTTWYKDEAKKYGGYNFAFIANSRDAIWGAHKHKYGRHAVLFQNSGVHVHHYGDEEDQVIFWGRDVNPADIVLLTCDGDTWTVNSVDGRRDPFQGTYEECVEWVMKNIGQYRNVIAGRKRQPERVMETRQKGASLYSQGQSVVTIYRAMSAAHRTFRSMDYITLSRKFAIEHADHMTAVEGESYHVVKAVVSGQDVYDAYNPGEYFYDGPEKEGRVIYTPDDDSLMEDGNWLDTVERYLTESQEGDL